MTTTTQFHLPQTEQDDPEFVALVSRVLNATTRCYNPDDIYVVQIDRWFDHKWKGFSGCRFSQCGTWLGPALRVPAFHPHRVKSQVCLRRSVSAPGGYELVESPPLHTDKRTNPGDRPRLDRISPSGLWLWHSSKTKELDRASLMVYVSQGEEHLSWYASFLKRGEWKVGLTKGISPEVVMQFAHSSGAPAGRVEG